jgi:hypothetical protein
VKIVRTRGFDKDLRRIGATARDLDGLIADLAANPLAGDVVVGLRGVRKVRFTLPSRNIGKRGGGRAIYLMVRTDDLIILIMAFAKTEQTDLSQRQRKLVLAFLEEIDNG